MNEENAAIMVLGASRGLGRATALVLAASGYRVGVACRSLADAESVAAQIEAAGGTAFPSETDVTDPYAVDSAFDALCTGETKLAGVVNNAGAIAPIGAIGEVDAALWAQNVSSNLVGAFHGSQAAIRRFAAGGIIVNLSSKAAETPLEGWSAYCASKAGLAMLTRSIALEYGARGILAYGLRPGLVDTDMQAAIRQSGINPVSRIPQSDLISPKRPAQLITWLFAAKPEDLSGGEIDIRDPALIDRIAQHPLASFRP